MSGTVTFGEPERGESGDGTPFVKVPLVGLEDGRYVAMTGMRAREYALSLLALVTSAPAGVVENWITGQIRVTVEAPTGCEDLMDPSFFVKPKSRESFEAIIAAAGGVVAFNPIDADQSNMRAYIPALGDGAELTLWVDLPNEMRPRLPKPQIEAMVKLRERQDAALAQQAQEQTAADALAAERSLPTAILDLLIALDEPCSAAKIGALLDPSVDEQKVEMVLGQMEVEDKTVMRPLGDHVNVVVAATGGDWEATSLPDWTTPVVHRCPVCAKPRRGVEMIEHIADEHGVSQAETYKQMRPAAPRSRGGIMADPLAPGPGKDGHP
jgi:hypothetical protein